MGLPNYVPMFPGAGTGNASDPLVGGMLCDYVPGPTEQLAEPVTQCFFGNGQTTPSATLEQVLECVDGKDAIHLRLTFDPSFVDNTYGTGAICWPQHNQRSSNGPCVDGKYHSFGDLVESDHAELKVTDSTGTVVSHFALDYISPDASAPSGYACLGVTGGEGKMIVGNASDIVDYSSSLDENLNARGYGSYTTDSPATDHDYTPNPATPEWDYRVVYEVWIDVKVLGSNMFGDAFIEYVHASPSKAATNTIEVKPGSCPPCTDPDGCWDTPPSKCTITAPDEYKCDTGNVPPLPPGSCIVTAENTYKCSSTDQPPPAGCVVQAADVYQCEPGHTPPLPPSSCVEDAPDLYVCHDENVPPPSDGCVVTGPDQYICAPGDMPPVPPEQCMITAPDQYNCYDAGQPPPPTPTVTWCMEHPELPECIVD
ncbi:MAG TPA: hypothetical protein VHM19_02870 [Polyangiales bacterium]|nr:hypothetical protein [Polyangiales bacterium]